MLKKLTLAAAVFAAFPTVSLAMGGCPHGSYEQTQSCAQGTVWNAETKTCETVTTG